MAKMNQRMLKFAEKMKENNAKKSKFARLQAKAAKLMARSQSNDKNIGFLELMDKAHIFDSLNQVSEPDQQVAE